MDPLWNCLCSDRSISRNQLEIAISKKKIGDVLNWFEEHFVNSSKQDYCNNRCPILFIQGPTGCGKTSTLRWIARHLNLRIKEYNDDSVDYTTLLTDLKPLCPEEKTNNLSLNIAQRQLKKFEQFITQNVLFRDLSSSSNHTQQSSQNKVDGVIIFIETPLRFAHFQRLFTQCILRLRVIIRDLSKRVNRRVAVVFESLDSQEGVNLPTKTREKIGLQVFKFNPITSTNMAKFVDHLVKQFPGYSMDKEVVEMLVNDSNGDIRACINSLQVIFNSHVDERRYNSPGNITKNFAEKLDFNGRDRIAQIFNNNSNTMKKMKTHHYDKRIHDFGLSRGNSKNIDFLHLLGKIFYQKRLYPEHLPTQIGKQSIPTSYSSSISLNGYNMDSRDSIDSCAIRISADDRPYPTETKTEELVGKIDIGPDSLMPWLHQHYTRFCPNNIEKAAKFSENLSLIDTISLNSTQSSQFYELHPFCDEIQKMIAVEATIFSLYHELTGEPKKSDKKIRLQNGEVKYVRSSVAIDHSNLENENGKKSFGEFGFKRPTLLSQQSYMKEYSILMDNISSRYGIIDSKKFRLDYVPHLVPILQTTCEDSSVKIVSNVCRELDTLGVEKIVDTDTRLDTLKNLIDQLENCRDFVV